MLEGETFHTPSLRRRWRRGRRANAMQPGSCRTGRREPLAGLRSHAHCIACCTHLDMFLQTPDVARHRSDMPRALIMLRPAIQSQIVVRTRFWPPEPFAFARQATSPPLPTTSRQRCLRTACWLPITSASSPGGGPQRHPLLPSSSAPQGRLYCSFRPLPTARHGATILVKLMAPVQGHPSGLVNPSSGRRLWLHTCKPYDRAA